MAELEPFLGDIFFVSYFYNIFWTELIAELRTVVTPRRDDSLRVGVGRMGRFGGGRLGTATEQLPQPPGLVGPTTLRLVLRRDQDYAGLSLRSH